jgi:hypothetical protein
MTNRKSSNVCPVCGAQGKLDIVVSYYCDIKFTEYVVTCKCQRRPLVGVTSKRWAWWWFRNMRTVKMRDLKNYWRRADIWRRNDIRGGRLTREAINLKFKYARLKHS